MNEVWIFNGYLIDLQIECLDGAWGRGFTCLQELDWNESRRNDAQTSMLGEKWQVFYLVNRI